MTHITYKNTVILLFHLKVIESIEFYCTELLFNKTEQLSGYKEAASISVTCNNGKITFSFTNHLPNHFSNQVGFVRILTQPCFFYYLISLNLNFKIEILDSVSLLINLMVHSSD